MIYVKKYICIINIEYTLHKYNAHRSQSQYGANQAREQLFVIGSTFCQSPSMSLAKRPRHSFLSVFFISSFTSVLFFSVCLSAEGPRLIVNQKNSFNIILSLAPAGDWVRRRLWFSAQNSAVAHAPRRSHIWVRRLQQCWRDERYHQTHCFTW